MCFNEKSTNDSVADRTLCHTDHLLSGEPGYYDWIMHIRSPASFQHGLRISAAEVGVQRKADPVLESAAEVMPYPIDSVDPCIYSGNDDQILPILSLGGIGVISVVANVAPQETHDMVIKFLEGDIETAKKLQLDMIELCDALFCEVNPIPVKAALKLMGWNTGSLRLPLTEISDKGMAQLKQAMENYGLLK